MQKDIISIFLTRKATLKIKMLLLLQYFNQSSDKESYVYVSAIFLQSVSQI